MFVFNISKHAGNLKGIKRRWKGRKKERGGGEEEEERETKCFTTGLFLQMQIDFWP